MIFAVLTGGLPNRITAVTLSRVTFVPTRSGSSQEPALIQYLAVNTRVMTESEAFAVSLERVDRLSDISAEHEGEAVRSRSAIVVDIGAMPGADRRLADLVSGLPRYRAKEITIGRVALKGTAPAIGRVPGVVGRVELINQFNARAVPIVSEDITDPARLPGKVIQGPMALVVRTIGIARATVKIGFANLVYTMNRAVWLVRQTAEPA